jgi:hypothetical protein
MPTLRNAFRFSLSKKTAAIGKKVRHHSDHPVELGFRAVDRFSGSFAAVTVWHQFHPSCHELCLELGREIRVQLCDIIPLYLTHVNIDECFPELLTIGTDVVEAFV